jgi:hypothetical protein
MHSISLLHDLPLPALAVIYQHCDGASRTALLRVSAGCLDWVLREARSIVLKVPNRYNTGARKPLARLLNRACTQSAGNLALCMDFSLAGNKKTTRNNQLSDLLEPGIQQSGWTSVATLVLEVRRACEAKLGNAQARSVGNHQQLTTPCAVCRDPLAPAHLPSCLPLPSQHYSSWS